ncbi:MAG: helix-hairpin-helix domain-containing protein [Deltaproteobacteria bacterium]
MKREIAEAPFPVGRVLAAVLLAACLVLVRHGASRMSGRPAPPPEYRVHTDGVFRPIDLNSASFEELTDLPGIGEKRAEAILKLRCDLGFFLVTEDLLLSPSIGVKHLAALRPYVTTKSARRDTDPA